MKLFPAKLLHSFSEIFFLNDYRFGLGLIAMLSLYPHLVLSGLLAVLSARGYAGLFGGTQRIIVQEGVYTYNPFLVGLTVGAYLEPTATSIGLIVAGGILTLLVTAWTAQLAESSFGLPVLSVPFALMSLLLLLAVAQYPELMPRASSSGSSAMVLPPSILWLSGYFRSLGAIVFVPEDGIGLLIGLLILCRSRILFLLSFCGYYLGSGLYALVWGALIEPSDVFPGLNFILTAMALGGFFFVPSVQSLLQAAIGIAATVLAADALKMLLAGYGLPVLTLPFVMATWAVSFGARVFGNVMIPTAAGRTPEELLENHVVQKLRFTDPGRIIHLPFSGEWTVWQGVAGRWTHRGLWQHAFDFVVTDAEGQTFSGNGQRLTDYHAYGKPVLAPCSGRVVRVVAELADNPIGEVNPDQRWGNLVILEHPDGCYVEISHFSSHSVCVAEGQWVQRGSILGKCGNSGYSPQPHIHIQVQPTAAVGAATVPFCFAGYVCEHGYHPLTTPEAGQKIQPVWPNPDLEQKAIFRIGETFRLEAAMAGEKTDSTVVRVEMGADGSLFLASDRGRLYFGRRGDMFYFYGVDGDDPLLMRIFLAIPRIPLVRPDYGNWTDWVSTGRLTSDFRRQLIALCAVFHHRLAAVETDHRFVGSGTIESRLTPRMAGKEIRARLEFGQQRLIRRIVFDDMEIHFSPVFPVRGEGTPTCPGSYASRSALGAGLKNCTRDGDIEPEHLA